MKDKDNIDKQYDEVMKYIDGYRLFVRSFVTRLLQFRFAQHTLKARFAILLDLLRHGEGDLLSGGGNADLSQKWIEIATEEQKRSEYYPIFTSEYPVNELSWTLEKKFPDVVFDQLKQLHESKESYLSWFGVKEFIAVVLAVATILLKSIPESVVSRVINYKRFELITFLAASAVMVYVSVALLPFWRAL